MTELPITSIVGVCSAKPRPLVQGPRSYNLKNGHAAWGRDIWHIRNSGVTTLCGRDSSEYLNMGEMTPDHHLCRRCAEKARIAYEY